MYEQEYKQKKTQTQKEILIKDKKYLSGVLTGFILMAIIMIGVARYQDNQILVDENGNILTKKEILSDSSNMKELKEKIKADVDEIQSGKTEIMTPETPHSPQLQRLDLILREAERMTDRIQKDIDKINGTQTATIN